MLRATPKLRGLKTWTGQVQVLADVQTRIEIELTSLDKVIKGRDGAEMDLISGETFEMGSSLEEVVRVVAECKGAGDPESFCKERLERELPRHQQPVEAFYLDRYEVTNAQFAAFVNAQGYRTTAEQEGWGSGGFKKGNRWQEGRIHGASWCAPSGPGTSAEPTHPVVQVSWMDAVAYCRWAGKRLPTEAEWELAARGTDGRLYPWGETWDPSKANGVRSVGSTKPVGSYPAGMSPFGIHDLAGNVAEWTSSLFRTYPYSTSDGREGPDEALPRVHRGGSWFHNVPGLLRTTFRGIFTPTSRHNYRGFRCAQDGRE
jgi:iron(II)-dependent oxidoreductase